VQLLSEEGLSYENGEIAALQERHKLNISSGVGSVVTAMEKNRAPKEMGTTRKGNY